jgi:carbonic anhydrase/acetyltransferase-like protein (isoleucine patch superfamily)
LHPTAYVHPDATVIGRVRLGEQASVWTGAVLRADFGRIEVGARTSIQDGTIVHTTDTWPTLIGADCVVGHNAHLEGCQVRDRCLIGSGSVVLNRAVVEAGGFVAAGALVPEDFVVPSGQLAIGVPARLRPAGARLPEWITRAVRNYVDNAARYSKELRRLDG